MAKTKVSYIALASICIAGLGLAGAFAQYTLSIIVGTSERITKIEDNVSYLSKGQERIEKRLDDIALGSVIAIEPKKPKQNASYP